MKLLQIHAEFKLSDDFEGNLADALLQLADYMALKDPAFRECEPISGSDGIRDWEIEALAKLTEMNKQDGTRYVGEAFSGEWPKK